MDTNRRNFLTALGAGVAAVTEVADAGTAAEVKVEALPTKNSAHVLVKCSACNGSGEVWLDWPGYPEYHGSGTVWRGNAHSDDRQIAMCCPGCDGSGLAQSLQPGEKLERL